MQPPVYLCRLEWWTICMLTFLLVGVIHSFLFKHKQIHLFRGYLYSNASHVMLFVSDIYRYVPIRMERYWQILDFKILGHLDNITITLRKYFIWGSLEINWSQMTILVNGKELQLPL